MAKDIKEEDVEKILGRLRVDANAAEGRKIQHGGSDFAKKKPVSRHFEDGLQIRLAALSAAQLESVLTDTKSLDTRSELREAGYTAYELKVCGYAAAGKTLLVNRLLAACRGRLKIGVIVHRQARVRRRRGRVH